MPFERLYSGDFRVGGQGWIDMWNVENFFCFDLKRPAQRNLAIAAGTAPYLVRPG